MQFPPEVNAKGGSNFRRQTLEGVVMKIEYKYLNETPYQGLSDVENAMYCEITYNRDISSFAGAAFILTDNKGISFSKYKEFIFKEPSKFEKIYVGMEESYCDSMVKIYNELNINQGIHILFIVYSDVRSSMIVFAKLMGELNKYL